MPANLEPERRPMQAMELDSDSFGMPRHPSDIPPELLGGPAVVPEGFTSADMDSLVRAHEAQTIAVVWAEAERRISQAWHEARQVGYGDGIAAGRRAVLEIEADAAREVGRLVRAARDELAKFNGLSKAITAAGDYLEAVDRALIRRVEERELP